MTKRFSLYLNFWGKEEIKDFPTSIDFRAEKYEVVTPVFKWITTSESFSFVNSPFGNSSHENLQFP